MSLHSFAPKIFGFPASSLSSEKCIVSKIVRIIRHLFAFTALIIHSLSDKVPVVLYSTTRAGGWGVGIELKETNRLILCPLKNES